MTKNYSMVVHMPSELEGVVRFPVVYQPWYVYLATLVGSPASYEFFDILFPAAGLFDRAVTNNQIFITGFAIALEKFTTGDLTVQVAIPGSAIPFLAGGVVEPGSLVKMSFAASKQKAVAASAADLAAGLVIGRQSNHVEDHENLRVAADLDIVVIRTGIT